MKITKLKIGMIVKEKSKEGYKGVVVKIIEGTNDENHGTVFVWQMDRMEYGADNCEHYPYFGWETSLKVIKDVDK